MHPLLALYKGSNVNQISSTTSVLRTLDVEALCNDYRSLMAEAPQRHRANKRYFVEHTGRPSGAKKSGRSEEHLAMALANNSRFNGRSFALPDGRSLQFLDYQVPLKERRSDEGVGKVDLVGILEDETLVIVELKVLNSASNPGNTPLQAFLEGLAYSAIVQANRSAIGAELQSAYGFQRNSDRLLLCVLAPEDYWYAVALKSDTKEVIRFANQVGARLDLEIQFLSMQDSDFEMGNANTAPRLTGACTLSSVDASANRLNELPVGPDPYSKRLCEQFWLYASDPALIDPVVLDRDQTDATRPPVFLKQEAWRNVLLPPACDRSTKRKVLDALPMAKRHRWFGSMKSSQALAQSIFGNLIASENFRTLGDLIDDDGLPAFFPEIGDATLSLEHDVQTLNEPRSTSVDLWVRGAKTVAVECKLTEAEFGKCSRPRRDPAQDPDYCDGSYRVQMNRHSRCALTELGISYWRYIPLLFDWSADRDMLPCAFGANYQLVRNVLAACVNEDGTVSTEGRHALVLYDERNPAFQTGGFAQKQWQETKAALRYPDLLRRCSWQRFADLLTVEPALSWLVDGLAEKYGITSPKKETPPGTSPNIARKGTLPHENAGKTNDPIGRLIIDEEEALKWLSTIHHEKCASALCSGAWEVSDGVARPKSLLWLDCWARTGLNSKKAKIAAKHAFEAIFGLDHRAFSKRIEHAFSRRYRNSFSDEYVRRELKRRIGYWRKA